MSEVASPPARVRPTLAFMLAHPAHVIALGLGAGLSPWAPGTLGTLVAIPLAFALWRWTNDIVYLAAVLALLIAGAWSAERTGRALGRADHGSIVVDEVAAFLLVLFFTGPEPARIAFAFALFRLFDITKPPPIRAIDARMKSGLGVMADDLVAAAFALLVFAAVVRLTGVAVNDAASLRRVEEAGFNNLHTRRQLFYDGWLLFLLPGKAKRARSANPHFGSTLPLADKIAHCERIYTDRGLPMLFRITPFAQPEAIDGELAARGYVAFDRTVVQLAELDAPPAAFVDHDLALENPMPDAFVEAIGELRGSSPGERAAHLERLAQSPLDLRAVVARVDGVAVAAGLVAVDGPLAGVFDVGTAPSMRGEGIGTAVVAALLARAWERGARQAFLQVAADNGPALAIYRKFGFATAYSYHYRAPPGQCR